MTLLALVVLLTAGAQVALLLGFATLLLLRRERSAIGARGGEPGRRP
ncbi:MAG: hypothetical protein HOQ19_15055, partial [Gemmatimonadaceae bacterium]|nr:hypothetical protein [Gemmatimonadaceae bacterium]